MYGEAALIGGSSIVTGDVTRPRLFYRIASLANMAVRAHLPSRTVRLGDASNAHFFETIRLTSSHARRVVAIHAVRADALARIANIGWCTSSLSRAGALAQARDEVAFGALAPCTIAVGEAFDAHPPDQIALRRLFAIGIRRTARGPAVVRERWWSVDGTARIGAWTVDGAVRIRLAGERVCICVGACFDIRVGGHRVRIRE